MKKYIKCFIPVIITCLIICIIYITNGLYPFGSNSIVQVDADYQFIPILYRIYDFLQGSGSIIYDDIGFGNSIYTSLITQGSLFSPINLLLFFTRRGNIVNFYNVFLMIKLCLLSLTSYIYINKTYKVDIFYNVLFCILYTFSGWILLNYFNIMWIDCVIFFPLIVMYLNSLLQKNKYIGYIVSLSLSLITSYYISYYILLFVLFYSFIYIMNNVEKENRKTVVFRLGISTLISIFISSFSLIPCLYQVIISSRFSTTSSALLLDCFMEKTLHLLMSPFLLFIYFKLLARYKYDKLNIINYITLFLLFGIGIIIEPINLAIHGGSHWNFVYRYSFITLFILMSGGLYYIENFKNSNNKNDNQIIYLILFFILGIGLMYINNQLVDLVIKGQIVLDFKDVDIYKKILYVVVLIMLMIFLAFQFNNKHVRYIAISISCLSQIFIFSSYTMYYSNGYYLSRDSNTINNNIDIVHENRYKMNYINYTPDYAFIYNVSGLDNWLHILPDGIVNTYNNLGYQTTDTCIRGYGGTIFTDWLFDVKYLISNTKLDDSLYQYVDSYNDMFYLYKYTYDSGFGITYNENVDLDNYISFYLQNEIYKNLFSKKDDLIKINNYIYEDVDKVDINYSIKEKGFLYIDFYNTGIVDYIKIGDNFIYNIDDYIKYLGIYKDIINIEIYLKGEYNSIQFDVGFIKYDDIMNMNNKNIVTYNDNSYNIKINNNKDRYLFLPINNIPGLYGVINNKNIKLNTYDKNFVSIPLKEGINDIIIKYELPYLTLGIILSIIGIIMLFCYKYLIVNNKMIINITYYIYIGINILVYVYIYICSLFKYYIL